MEGQNTRTLPHNLEAETAVLEAVLRDNSTLAAARAIIQPRDFFRDAHKVIFGCMSDMADRGVEIEEISLCEELQRIGKLDFVNGPGYVGSLVGTTRLYRDASEYVTSNARNVARHSQRRRVIFDFDSAINKAYQNEPLEELAEHARAIVDHIATPSSDSEALRGEWLIGEETRKERARRAARRTLDSEVNTARVLKKPGLRTLTELLAMPRQPVRYVINGLLREGGRAILAAQFKTGKTTFIQNLCLSLVDGRPFLDHFDTHLPSGNVCVIDTEMIEDQGVQWFADGGIRNTDRVRIEYLRGSLASFNIMLPEVRDAWVEILRAHECRFLVTDCLKPLLDVAGMSEKDQVGPWLLAYDELLLRAGIPNSVLVHHMGHSNDRVRGDSRLRDWPDAEWFLSREKAIRKSGNAEPESEKLDGPRFFKANGRDVSVPEQQLAYDQHTRWNSLISGSGNKQVSAMNTAISLVYDWLGDRELPKTVIESKASADQGLGRNTVRDAIAAGLVARVFSLADGPKNNTKLIKRGPGSPVRHGSPVSIRQTGSPFATSYMEGRTGGRGIRLISSPDLERLPKAVPDDVEDF